MRRQRHLTCGCCGNGFRGRQHWNYDKGFGQCPECCEWILSTPRWWYNHDEIRAAVRDQFTAADAQRLLARFPSAGQLSDCLGVVQPSRA